MAIQDIMDHGGPDPIQGFDVDVWVQDPSRNDLNVNGLVSPGDQAGSLVLLGSFTSIVVTMRNATEAYMELNQRMPRYLDGEFQIAWVMEKGMLDIWMFKQTFGFSTIRRNIRFNRSPRFVITFQSNTNGELHPVIHTPNLTYTNNVVRQTDGRIALYMCKPDSLHIAATAGKQVVASQWQGVAEGFTTLSTPLFTETVGVADTTIPSTPPPGP